MLSFGIINRTELMVFLQDRKFEEVTNGISTASMSGIDLYKQLKEQFYDRGGL